MKENRLRIETEILKKYFPDFEWIPNTDPQGLDVRLKSNSGVIYKLSLHLPSDFPNAQPSMFITSPNPLKVYNKERNLLNGSASMHTLGAVNGHVQICHYKPDKWSPNITLYKVVLKGRIWLEAYEIYLKTGNDIDTYLPHQ